MTRFRRIGIALLLTTAVLAVVLQFNRKLYVPAKSTVTDSPMVVTNVNGVETFNYHVSVVSQRGSFHWQYAVGLLALGLVGTFFFISGSRHRGT